MVPEAPMACCDPADLPHGLGRRMGQAVFGPVPVEVLGANDGRQFLGRRQVNLNRLSLLDMLGLHQGVGDFLVGELARAQCGIRHKFCQEIKS